MTALLAGDAPELETLRAQYAAASVASREVTPHGLITRFDVPGSMPLVDRKLLHLDDLQLQLEGAAAPCDTSVHVHNGRLRSLECFVYEGVFPEQPAIETAWYYGTSRHPAITGELMAERDVEELLDDGE